MGRRLNIDIYEVKNSGEFGINFQQYILTPDNFLSVKYGSFSYNVYILINMNKAYIPERAVLRVYVRTFP